MTLYSAAPRVAASSYILTTPLYGNSMGLIFKNTHHSPARRLVIDSRILYTLAFDNAFDFFYDISVTQPNLVPFVI